MDKDKTKEYGIKITLKDDYSSVEIEGNENYQKVIDKLDLLADQLDKIQNDSNEKEVSEIKKTIFKELPKLQKEMNTINEQVIEMMSAGLSFSILSYLEMFQAGGSDKFCQKHAIEKIKEIYEDSFDDTIEQLEKESDELFKIKDCEMLTTGSVESQFMDFPSEPVGFLQSKSEKIDYVVNQILYNDAYLNYFGDLPEITQKMLRNIEPNTNWDDGHVMFLRDKVKNSKDDKPLERLITIQIEDVEIIYEKVDNIRKGK